MHESRVKRSENGVFRTERACDVAWRGVAAWRGCMARSPRLAGLDNSPMYDGEMFQKNLTSHGTYSVGQMTM